MMQCHASAPLSLAVHFVYLTLPAFFTSIVSTFWGKANWHREKGEKNSTFVFLAGVCVYTQTESHKKTGLEGEAFLSSFITTHDEGSVWRAFGAAYSNSSLGYRHKITQSWKTVQ